MQFLVSLMCVILDQSRQISRNLSCLQWVFSSIATAKKNSQDRMDGIWGLEERPLKEDVEDDECSTERKKSAVRDLSPFALALEKHCESKMKLTDQVNGISANELHSPEVAKYLEIHFFAVAPLWTGIVLGKCLWSQHCDISIHFFKKTRYVFRMLHFSTPF